MPESNSNKATLAKKLLQVSSQLESIGKSGYNPHQKYNYSTEKDLHDVLKPALEAVGVSISWSVQDVQFLKNDELCLVQVLYTLTDVDTGETVECVSAGTGADKQDKAIYKAFTGAHKYFMMKCFLVSGEDDPENEGSRPAASKASSGRPPGAPGGAPKPAAKAAPKAPPAPQQASAPGWGGGKPKAAPTPPPVTSAPVSTPSTFGSAATKPVTKSSWGQSSAAPAQAPQSVPAHVEPPPPPPGVAQPDPFEDDGEVF